MQERLQTIRSELATVTAACEVVSGEYCGLQRRARTEICRSRAGGHRALAVAVGRAALRVLDAAQAEEAFRDDPVRQGLKVCRPIFPAIWKTTHYLRESIVIHFLKELDAQILGIRDEVMNDHADDCAHTRARRFAEGGWPRDANRPPANR